MPTKSEFNDGVPFILDSDSREVEYLSNPADVRETHYAFPQIEFTDDDGYVFRHVVDRQAPTGEIKGRWELVGARKARQAMKMRLGMVIPPSEIHPSHEYQAVPVRSMESAATESTKQSLSSRVVE
ncbi:hypothetical protein [Rhodococcus globerulus]|uniref:hypothetical protein n=1 Tax=Rhodococcus globerulus TaxID=33008 RepID=UPI00301A6769